MTHPRSLSKEWQVRITAKSSNLPISLKSTIGHCLAHEPLNSFHGPMIHGGWSAQTPLQGNGGKCGQKWTEGEPLHPSAKKPIHPLFLGITLTSASSARGKRRTDVIFSSATLWIQEPSILCVGDDIHLPASAGDTRDMNLIPRSGRSPREGNGNPFQ